MPEEKRPLTPEEDLAAREVALAAREAELAREQAEFEAQRAAQQNAAPGKKRGLLDNGDPNFVNPKEKIYDRFPLTVHQLDILIAVLVALIVLFLFLGVNHISFFGLFGG